MNWDEFQGNWKELQGILKTKWGKLTDDDLLQINGSKDMMIGKIQELYGETKQEIEKSIQDLMQFLSS